MRLPKVTRQRIYAARGKALQIPWPAEREPKVNGLYTIGTDVQLRVLDCHTQPEGIVATVRLEGDPIRLLAKKTGYTDFEGRAMDSEEPEAVSASDQRELCVAGRTRFSEHRTEQAADDARRQQERAVRDRLRETLRGLDAAGQTALLARVEREINETEEAL